MPAATEENLVREAFLAPQGVPSESAAPPPVASIFDVRHPATSRPADFSPESFPVLTTEVPPGHPAVLPDPPGFQPRGTGAKWPSVLAAGALLLLGGYWFLAPSSDPPPADSRPVPANGTRPGSLGRPTAPAAPAEPPAAMAQEPPPLDEPPPSSESEVERAFALPPGLAAKAPAQALEGPAQASSPGTAQAPSAVRKRALPEASRATSATPCTPTVAALGLCALPSPPTKE